MPRSTPSPHRAFGFAVFHALAVFTSMLDANAVRAGEWHFVDITADSGLVSEYSYVFDRKPIEPRWICTGAAAGDFDDDGFTDLYLVGGELGRNVLYRNLGDGTFEDVTAAAGVEVEGVLGCGPIFVDLDGDGDDDLLVPSVHGSPEHVGQPAVNIPAAYPRVFTNRGGGVFDDTSAASGFNLPYPTYSTAFSDIDGDGDLDAFLSHWRFTASAFLWRNDGAGVFTEATSDWFTPQATSNLLYAFTPNFADLDGDRRPDLVVAADFGHSRVLRNLGSSFAETTTSTISDQNGMGAAVGDFDNDGDLDWFVSSIWDPNGIPEANWGTTGNRLYRNRGNGVFDDVTDAAGVRHGYWGWGSCFADFDNDGDLDLFHVNGFPAAAATEFHNDPARFFSNQGDGTFEEQSALLGLDDTGQGRGVVCFDLERDGDIDLLIVQNAQPARLLRNDLPAGTHFLTVELDAPGPNRRAVGARVELKGGGSQQMREIQLGSNFVSQNRPEAHFGVGAATLVEQFVITWPQGQQSKLGGVATDQHLVVVPGSVFGDGFEVGSTAAWNLVQGN